MAEDCSVMEGYLGAEVFLKLKVSESESTREPVIVAKAVLELRESESKVTEKNRAEAAAEVLQSESTKADIDAKLKSGVKSTRRGCQ